MTLLVDEKGKIAKMYDADHWVLPLSKRVYLIVNQNLKVLYRKDMGFALLPDQTQTLTAEIDRVTK
jgi:peroxiredoxin